ncbi:LTA synthase family protein [Thalassobacillus pellis]|uniref:LTA synthase family protein n=1 Tax=Thalassobacillus pellis TaxID=748008 RepID=UPI00196049D8|nr:LTA synthase family protein [Thalassobacillus pellis]MBM7551681.1 phosphoglycerol transferase MdoB-like AlkP superfamily enzyme [Thalassobacillus pellis]
MKAIDIHHEKKYNGLSSFQMEGNAVHILKSIGAFVLRHIEIPILSALLFIKIFWFAQEVGIHLLTEHRLLVNVGSVIVLFSFGLLFKRVNRLLYFFFVGLIGAFIVYADLVYFRYFGDLITTPVLSHSTQMGDISGSITELMAWADLKYFFDIIIVLVVFIILKIKKVKQYIMWKERLPLFVIAIIVGSLLVAVPIKSWIDANGKNLFINTWSNVSIYNVTGHLGFHVFETQKYINNNIINAPEITEEEKVEIKSYFEEKFATNTSKEEPFFGAGEGYNVMMIQLESFHNYLINSSINGKEITPHLNDLIGESFYFSNFYHQVAQGRTSDAELLTQTSLYPLPTGSVYVREPMNTFDALPGILKEKGYATSVYHAYEKTFWNRSTVYPNYGFERFVGKGDFGDYETAGPFKTVGDEGVFMQMTEENADDQPFYAFTVALTSHHPFYNIPSKYYELNTKPFDGTTFAHYLHATHYVDYAIGQLVEKMKAEGVWENTILMIYGDHDSGLEFTEKHAKALGLPGDPISILNRNDKVPMIIHVPGLEEKAKTFENSVGLSDVAPTLLHLLGNDSDYYHFGENMLNGEDQLVAFRYGSYKKGDIYYEASLDGSYENGTCYNVEKLEKLPVGQCLEDAQRTREILNMSDKIILHDLIAEWRKVPKNAQAD